MNTQDWSWRRYSDDPARYRMVGANFHPGPNWPTPGPTDYQSTSNDPQFEPDYLDWRIKQMQAHDAEYRRWRVQEAKRYDDLYLAWRDQRRSGFHSAFNSWRASRETDDRDLPLDASSVEFASAGPGAAASGPPLDLGSAQINDIANGGAGHGQPAKPV